MPKDTAAVSAFEPEAGEYKMKWSEVVPIREVVVSPSAVHWAKRAFAAA
jgi:hypothetical protein